MQFPAVLDSSPVASSQTSSQPHPSIFSVHIRFLSSSSWTNVRLNIFKSLSLGSSQSGYALITEPCLGKLLWCQTTENPASNWQLPVEPWGGFRVGGHRSPFVRVFLLPPLLPSHVSPVVIMPQARFWGLELRRQSP